MILFDYLQEKVSLRHMFLFVACPTGTSPSIAAHGPYYASAAIYQPNYALVNFCNNALHSNYWLGPDQSQTGWITLDIGCIRFVNNLLARNTRNGPANDR